MRRAQTAATFLMAVAGTGRASGSATHISNAADGCLTSARIGRCGQHFALQWRSGIRFQLHPNLATPHTSSNKHAIDAVQGSTENIFLFVPNLIGFGRVVLGVASLFYMADSPYTAMTLYWLRRSYPLTNHNYSSCAVHFSMLSTAMRRARSTNV